MVKGLKKQFRTLLLSYYNFGDGPDGEKFRDLQEIWSDGVDVIALSEHGDRDDVTERFLAAHPDWDKYTDGGLNGGLKECLLFKKELGTVTLEKSYTLVGKRKLAQGAGPENAGPKVAHRVRIRMNGRRVQFIVCHQYATVDNRLSAAWDFMRALMNVARGLRGVVFVLGDQNARPTHALVRALRSLLPSWVDPGPTHKTRTIDYIVARGAKIIRSWTKKLSSDHRAVFAEARIPI